MRIHDALTGEQKLSLYGCATEVQDVSFSPDGTLIAAITRDGFARVWERQRSNAAILMPSGSAGRPQTEPATAH